MKKSRSVGGSTNNLQDLEKGGGRLDRPERAADSIAKSSKSFRATYNSNDVILAWKDLTVESTRGKGRLLLDNVSGQISAGFYAIMGPSGSGKTTLLNTLACRLDRGVKVHGYVRLNGQEYNNTMLKKMAGYVMQDDLLNVNFTVQETLYYTAQLRLPVELSSEEKQARIDKVMEQVGITHCRDTIVGSPMKKGISGGERKRLCVAMELLMEPLLLFLDEPTSGLDSMTALSLCRLLKNLADQKICSVICTLHQPQAKIFNMFDFLILLKSGSIAYQGPAGAALEHFAAIGFPCPTHENPADHFLDVISPYNPNDSVEDLVKKAEAIKLYYTAPEVDLHAGADRPLILPREVTPWTKQFSVLLRRSLKEQWRKRNIVFVQVIQAVIMAVLIGTAFLQIGTSQTSVTRRQPVLFFCCINQGIFGALIMINSFPSERMLSLRERAAGTYYVSAYFLAKITAETLTQLLTPIIFSCIVYWLVGLQPLASKFFIFMAFMVLCSLSSTSLALMVSAIARTTDMSVTILPMVLEISRLFGGYFLSPANLPAYFSWLDALSFVKYSYVAVSLNELTGLELYCTPSQYKYSVPANSHPNGTVAVCTSQCPTTSGTQTIDSLGLDFLTIAQCAGILISYITICRLFAYLGVRFIKW